MTVWVVLTVMVIVATAAILAPLATRQRPPQSRAEHDLEIYRDQLAEVDRDHARGLISETQVEAARTEIGRRLLAAEDAQKNEPQSIDAGTRSRLAAVLGVAVPLAAFGVYSWQGSPGLAGKPAAESARQSVTGPTATAPADNEMTRLVDRLADKLRENPDDPQGWTLLARSLSMLERYDDAAEAFAQAASLLPDDAEIRALYGAALIAANQGEIGGGARLAFVEALRRNPKEPRARFYLGLAALQAGDRNDALARWRALAADSQQDDQWMPMLRERMARLSGDAAQTATARAPKAAPAPDPPVTRGPSREDLVAAQRMSPQNRMNMIRGMVEGLAHRLAEEPDDTDGWARLARSYRVLGETKKARDALAQLARLKPNDVGVLTTYAQSILQTSDGGPLPSKLGSIIGRVLELDPNNRAGLWIAGLVAEQMGSKTETLRFWTRLKSQLPEGSSERVDLERRLDALVRPQ